MCFRGQHAGGNDRFADIQCKIAAEQIVRHNRWCIERDRTEGIAGAGADIEGCRRFAPGLIRQCQAAIDAGVVIAFAFQNRYQQFLIAGQARLHLRGVCGFPVTVFQRRKISEGRLYADVVDDLLDRLETIDPIAIFDLDIGVVRRFALDHDGLDLEVRQGR